MEGRAGCSFCGTTVSLDALPGKAETAQRHARQIYLFLRRVGPWLGGGMRGGGRHGADGRWPGAFLRMLAHQVDMASVQHVDSAHGSCYIRSTGMAAGKPIPDEGRFEGFVCGFTAYMPAVGDGSNLDRHAHEGWVAHRWLRPPQ
jgi:hypothetical protein